MLDASKYRRLGRTGLLVSPLALGSDNFANPTPVDECVQIMGRALDRGINLIDTSNSYAAGQSEEIIGRYLQETGRRDEVILATKAYYPTGKQGVNDRGTSRRHLMRACEDSLTRLRTDYIDLYQTHRVCMETPLEETLGALTDLQRQGKIRYAGSTTSPAWKITEASMLAEYRQLIRMVSEQTPYNLLDRRVENELLPAATAADLAVFTWSPLAMGMLTGRYDPQRPETFRTPRFERGGIYAERITARAAEAGQEFVKLAARFDLPPAQLALLWVKDQPGVTAPLCGPRTADQLDDLLPVIEMTLTEDMQAACDQLVPPGCAIADFLNSAPWMKGKVR
ncbi:MAG TPA: aldo/keto reductase [Planctomycetaceae bacterium]|nr:aldo/keto reductase [Blastopirellula sp.]HAY82453.1 aldo/keto reductase [Planctomycetaceae bacterium]